MRYLKMKSLDILKYKNRKKRSDKQHKKCRLKILFFFIEIQETKKKKRKLLSRRKKRSFKKKKKLDVFILFFNFDDKWSFIHCMTNTE